MFSNAKSNVRNAKSKKTKHSKKQRWFAEHFPKENVQHQQNVRAASLFFAKQKTQHFCIKYISAPNTFLHQIHFCTKYISAPNTFLHQIHFCVHFPKENVQHQIHFCIKSIFCSQYFCLCIKQT